MEDQKIKRIAKNPSNKENSIDHIIFNDHVDIQLLRVVEEPNLALAIDSLAQNSSTNLVTGLSLQADIDLKVETHTLPEVKRRAANQIVEIYLNAEIKEIGGHSLMVSKSRFEKAYKAVHGHSVYEDLLRNRATKYYTLREVFDNPYASTSSTYRSWQSLPKKYRGRENTGAIAAECMGAWIDWFGIWSGELKPGVLILLRRSREKYE